MAHYWCRICEQKINSEGMIPVGAARRNYQLFLTPNRRHIHDLKLSETETEPEPGEPESKSEELEPELTEASNE